MRSQRFNHDVSGFRIGNSAKSGHGRRRGPGVLGGMLPGSDGRANHGGQFPMRVGREPQATNGQRPREPLARVAAREPPLLAAMS